MEKKLIEEQLLKKGSKKIKNLVVKNVTVTPMENYVRLGLTIDKPVEGFVVQEDGTYKKSEVKVIFVSLFSVISQLRDIEEASFACNHIVKNPMSAEVLLNGSIIDVIQEDVKEGDEYVNPWSEASTSTSIFTHDTIINHVVSIRITSRAEALLDRLALFMLGV